jgi:hypothetical protein
MVELSDIERKLNNVEKKLEDDTLAMEMLKELKKQGQYKFIIILILIVALIGTNIGWLIYNSQFETVTDEEQYIMQEQQDVENSTMSGVIN